MPVLRLSPAQKTRLCQAVQAEFTARQFAEFIWLELEELPYLITSAPYPANIADLVEWAEDRTRTGELLRKLQLARPANTELNSLCNEFCQGVVAVLHGISPASEAGELESIVLKSVQFEDVGRWLDRMARLRQAVCRIEPQPQTEFEESLDGYATGFLVAPSTVLTNYHVAANLLPNGKAARTKLRFGYEVTPDGKKQAGNAYDLAQQWLLAFSPVEALDYALLRLAPGDAPAPGFFQTADHQFAKDEPLIILQHPSARPLKLAIGTVLDPAYGPRVTYTVNTEAGSSGSPCLTSSLQTVALHHWGGSNHNRGIRLGEILEHVRATGNGALLESHGGI
jgi:hypothetical protein